MILLLLILGIIVFAVFAHMTLYVVGSLLGILLAIILLIIKRRKQR